MLKGRGFEGDVLRNGVSSSEQLHICPSPSCSPPWGHPQLVPPWFLDRQHG